MTLSDYVLSGKLGFRSGRSDGKGDFYVFKTPLTSGWHDEHGMRAVSNAGLRKHLIDEWPFETDRSVSRRTPLPIRVYIHF